MRGSALLEVYARWHWQQVVSRDLDPVYPVLARVAREWGLSRSQTVWLVLLHVTYYHLGSAIRAFTLAPSPRAVPRSLALSDLLTLPTGTERRAHRDRRQLARHLAALREACSPDPLRWASSGGMTWPGVIDTVMALHGNGRWAGYKTAEMFQKVCDFPIAATDAGHRYSSGPRKGLALLFDWTPTGQDDESIRALDTLTEALAGALGEDDVAQVETSLCDFASLVGGHYYLGHDIDQMQAQLAGIPEGHEVWASRRAELPPNYLGELHGWSRVDTARCRVFAETGEVVVR
jgi:hypothetical protein